MGERMVGRDDDEAGPVDRSTAARGRRIAAIIAWSWRREPPALEVSEAELDDVALAILRAKAGALAWWRIRNSPLRASAAGERLRAAYQNHGLQAALHAANVSRVVGPLRAAGIDPVLVKGPSIARLYPERGLRPFGDLDLCVRPDQYGAAADVLAGWVKQFSPVDLHSGFKDLNARGWDEVFARTQSTPFGAIEVRTLAAEDHLRFLCLHLLRHGVPTPLWLCDVAVVLESRPQAFDWDLVLGPDRREADWVACTIGLAHQLLGATVDDTPVAARARSLPTWLVPSVVEEWGRQCAADYQAPELSPDVVSLLAGAATTVRRYWPNPVAATVHLRRRFSNYPRMPIQLADAFARLARFSLRRLRGQRPDFDHL